MNSLNEHDLRAGVQLLHSASEAGADAHSFARICIEALPALVSSEVTTLSICDLRSGHRNVVGSPDSRLSEQDRACFDRHFSEHPLVRFHAYGGGQGAHRISDSVPFTRFRHTALYDEYYRRIGIDHAVAVPLEVDRDTLVSFVLNRRRRDFSDRDCAVLDLVRAPLGQIYRLARALERAQAALAKAPVPMFESIDDLRPGVSPLTTRENEVLRWVAAGKTDRDIADLLGCSHRTVQKHLERVYAKLGVETRTAAVMRALHVRLH